ncbi:hypothetical protein LINGRAHAP2_LOCUS23464 [Linum grandiflorum]
MEGLLQSCGHGVRDRRSHPSSRLDALERGSVPRHFVVCRVRKPRRRSRDRREGGREGGLVSDIGEEIRRGDEGIRLRVFFFQTCLLVVHVGSLMEFASPVGEKSTKN